LAFFFFAFFAFFAMSVSLRGLVPTNQDSTGINAKCEKLSTVQFQRLSRRD
jgi:hypothetical protein